MVTIFQKNLVRELLVKNQKIGHGVVTKYIISQIDFTDFVKTLRKYENSIAQVVQFLTCV